MSCRDMMRGPVLVAALGGLLSACASSGALNVDTGDIHQIVDASDPTNPRRLESTAGLEVYAPGSQFPIDGARGARLRWGDSLHLRRGAQARLRLRPAGGSQWEWVALSSALSTKRGPVLFGRTPARGRFAIDRDSLGLRVDVREGAVVLENWGRRGGAPICLWAAGACVRTSDASLAVQVDADGAAWLYVQSGFVNVETDASPMDAAVADPFDVLSTQQCDRVATRDFSCVEPLPTARERRSVTAPPGTAWVWTPGGEITPRREDPEVLAEALRFNGEDVWKERGLPWYPLLALPAAAIACVAAEVLFCDDNGDADRGIRARVRLVP